MDELIIHPNLKQLSNSSAVTLHRCPRRYELDKLSIRVEDDGDYHTAFGHLVGYGIANYFVSGDLDRTLFNCFLYWKGEFDDSGEVDTLDEGSYTKSVRDKKTFWHGLQAIKHFVALRKIAFSQYEVAYVNGIPATELGFRIDCGDGFAYRGLIDVVMVHKTKKKLAILECKTTKISRVHEAMFKHSGQALGYSVVADAIAPLLGLDGSEFDVYYPVYKSSAMEWDMFPFTKSYTQRALWIQNLLMDKMDVQRYAEQEHFPMRGESCYDFFRVCTHFGMCEMHNSVLFPIEPKERVEADDKYQFKFNLLDLITQQLARQG